MGRFDETILVTEERMKCAANADDPITEIALAVQEHYGCPWRAAEDVTLTVRREMLAKGWTVTRPNANALAEERSDDSQQRVVGGLSGTGQRKEGAS